MNESHSHKSPQSKVMPSMYQTLEGLKEQPEPKFDIFYLIVINFFDNLPDVVLCEYMRSFDFAFGYSNRRLMVQ